MAAADDAVIGCMPSPCVGELGAGIKKKSSANPMIIDTLGKAYILRSHVWCIIIAFKSNQIHLFGRKQYIY